MEMIRKNHERFGYIKGGYIIDSAEDDSLESSARNGGAAGIGVVVAG
jgi:hypothetical protein